MKVRSVVFLTAVWLLAGVAIAAILVRAIPGDRLEVRDLIARLEGGRIVPGTALDAASCPKPWIQHTLNDSGNGDGIIVYKQGDRVLLLFARGSGLFGACLLDGARMTPGRHVKWYFCDPALLSLNIESQLAENEPTNGAGSARSTMGDKPTGVRWTVAEVIELLDEGGIERGSAWPHAQMPRAWLVEGPIDAGETNVVSVYRERDRVLLVFVHRASFYAACLLDARATTAPSTGRVKWYFCDTELLARNVQLLLVENVAPSGQPRR